MDEFPRRFGSYVLLKPLARGGMGALYMAVSGDRGMEKLCVIKTVLPHLADKEYLQRFRDEAKVVVRLSHGNLVTVFDAGQVEGEIYLAMDFVEGKDLRATWNRCAQKGIAFPIDVAAHIVKELARGLGYAHSFGALRLVHRDVSPPNVLLSYTGEVKLTDFGLASSTLKLEKTAPGVIYGKVSYMAPEQARGEGLDGRTDLYAAGIILWELLTGRQLFPAASAGAKGDPAPADDVLARVRNPHVDPPSRRASRVPAELDRIALRALAADAPQRYQTGEELRSDLASYLARTAPATDTDRVAKFLRELFDPDMVTERNDRESLMSGATKLLASSSQAVRETMPGATGPAGSILAFDGAPPGSFAPPANVASLVEARGRRTTGDAPAAPGSVDVGRVSAVTVPVPAGDALGVVGTTIGGRYFVRRLSGEGGMGRVYEAEHIEIGKRVALKILHPVYTRTPDVVERFRREARATSRIGHPHIVDVTDSGTTDDGAFYFVMEYLEGAELGDVIHDGPELMEVGRALAIAAQICRALQAAHDAGVIHRDLKPENVLLIARDGYNDFVKVLDFGIAKSAEGEEAGAQPGEGRRLTHPGMTMGTPEYMAPEQAAGQPADPRTDIYAVGALLYEMLARRAPYEGKNFMEILHKKANEGPKPLSERRADVPPEVEALMLRAMARDPSGRPASMGALEREIMDLSARGVAAFDAGAVHGTPNGLTVTTAGRPSARRRRTFWAVGAVAAAGLFAAVWVKATGSDRALQPAASPGSATVAARQSAPAPAPVPLPPPSTAVAQPGAMAAATPSADPVPAAGTARSKPAGGGSGGRAAVAGGRGDPGGGLGAAESKKLLKKARELLAAQRFDVASLAFGKVLDSGRHRGAALTGLGHIAFQQQKYDQALDLAARGREAGGGVPALCLMGDAYYRLGRYTDSMKAYEAALGIDPNNKVALRGLELARKRSG